MKNRSKVTVTATALIILALMLSCAFVAFSADHECRGEDCAVCALCSLLSKTLGAAFLAALCVCASAVPLAVPFFGEARRTVASTPVRMKVKLSD